MGDLLVLQVGNRLTTDLGHRHTDHQTHDQRPDHEYLAVGVLDAELTVQMHRVVVHGEEAKEVVVRLGNGLARPVSVDVPRVKRFQGAAECLAHLVDHIVSRSSRAITALQWRQVKQPQSAPVAPEPGMSYACAQLDSTVLRPGMDHQIPFNRPYVAPATKRLLEEALGGQKFSGDGPMTRRARQHLEDLLGAPQVLLTTSCTHALEMAALLLDLGPGDEVIVPSFTFVSTVNAFVLRGATPVFVDVRPDTLNLDENLIEAAITPATRAIFPVHYAGVSCQMDAIMALARHHDLAVVEDAAQAIGSAWRGQPLGTIGQMGTLSFHETKNVSCGEGGALIVNRPEFFERAEIIREKGTDRSRFFRGEIDKYGWVDLGSSYLPSDLLAAFLLAQLEDFQAIQTRRREAWEFYDQAVQELAAQGWLETLSIPAGCSASYHLYGILLKDEAQRHQVQADLKAAGIHTTFHYQPLHLSVMGRKWGYRPGSLPVTESAADRLLRLPLYNDITAQELHAVVDGLTAALKRG